MTIQERYKAIQLLRDLLDKAIKQGNELVVKQLQYVIEAELTLQNTAREGYNIMLPIEKKQFKDYIKQQFKDYYSAKEHRITQMNKHQMYLQEQMDKLNEQIDKLNEQMDKLNEQIDKLNEQMDKLNEQIATLETQKVHLDEQSIHISERITILKEQVIFLETQSTSIKKKGCGADEQRTSTV